MPRSSGTRRHKPFVPARKRACSRSLRREVWSKQLQGRSNADDNPQTGLYQYKSLIRDREEFEDRMTDKRLGVYVGIDPTASSLHIGHLLPMMSMFWMYVHGYHTVQLLGGATAKIGDPTDRLTTRESEPAAIRTANMANMHLQLKKIWDNVEAYGRKYGYVRAWSWHKELVNNNAWWNKQPMLEVLQVLGPGMRLGSMLARDTWVLLSTLLTFVLIFAVLKTK